MKSIRRLAGRYPLLVVGVSSPSCTACAAVEHAYWEMRESLRGAGAKLVRVDGDRRHAVAASLGAQSLPHTVFFRKQRAITYTGLQTAHEMAAFLGKLDGSAVEVVDSAAAVADVLTPDKATWHGVPMPSHYVSVLGVFASPDGEDQDEWDDFQSVAARLRHLRDVYFFAVTDPELVEFALSASGARAAPAVVACRRTRSGAVHRATQDLRELYGGPDDHARGGDLAVWIQRESVRLVDELDATTFPRYEALGIPMAVLFLDLSSRDGNFLGSTDGLSNARLVVEAERAARAFRGRVAFVYCDGAAYEDKMRSLGILGGTLSLPAMAINSVGVRVPALDERRARDEAAMRTYVHKYLGHRLPREVEGAASGQPGRAAVPERRAPAGAVPAVVPGVAEQYEDELAIAPVGGANFSRLVGEEGVDVYLLLHRRTSAASAHMAPYVKRVARRLAELARGRARIVRMDLDVEVPPLATVDTSDVPSLVAFPAFSKEPPRPVFSGVAKVLPMLRWIAATADNEVPLPELPQFSDEERSAYKAQVRAREVARRAGRSSFSIGDIEREAEKMEAEAAALGAAAEEVP